VPFPGRLANLRGGPDNITALIIRVTPGVETNGAGHGPTAQSSQGAAPAVVDDHPGAGVLLAGGAACDGVQRRARRFAGLPGGVGSHPFRVGRPRPALSARTPETDREEEPSSPPRVHRRAACRIETPLLDRLSRAVTILKQRALDNHWDRTWSISEKHQALAEELLKAAT